MSDFFVLARKYRPVDFSHVVGQSHITDTLKNAIKAQRLPHSFLFCGPRGVGKTTCARILAKVVNCEQITKSTEPCTVCSSCTSFHSNSSMNVYELDAASNNSVEDIRALIEQIRYAPQVGKYKIYIIDEVHMLSSAAFNAFLKTLEEPPKYVLFILATTEQHKIIPTILSRCQIFNFRRIQPQHMVTQLKYIALKENILYEEEALYLISQKSEGSLRDALSIFDLLIAACGFGNTITYQASMTHLQVLDQTYYFKFITSFLKNDIATVLLLFNEVIHAGFDEHYFITGLSEHMRNLLLCQDHATITLLDIADQVQNKYQRQADTIHSALLLQALNLLNQCNIHYKHSANKRLHVELTLIDITILFKQNTESVTPIIPEEHNLPLASYNALKEKSTKSEMQEAREQYNAKEKTIQKKPAHHITLRDASSHIVLAHHHYHTDDSSVTEKSQEIQETISIPQIAQLKKKASKITNSPSAVTTVETSQPLHTTKEIVQSFLYDYAHMLKDQGDIASFNILNQPIQLEGTTILLSLVNPIQHEMLESIKVTLLKELRQKFKNSDLTIQGLLQCSNQTNKKPYSAQEKLDYFLNKYTILSMLQEQLLLELA